MTERVKIWFISLIGVLIFGLCAYNLPEQDRTLINYIGIIGFLLSILGIFISYIQIISIKQTSEATSKAVSDSIHLTTSIFLISDISKKILMINEIQNFLKADKIEMCVLRMKDLKTVLSDLVNHEEFSNLVVRKEFNTANADFNIDLQNFQRFLLNSKNKIDKEKIIVNLEQLATILLNVEVKLKKIRQ